MVKNSKRVVSVYELINTKFKVMDFDEQWLELFGKPEKTGCWIAWAESFNGKTSFMIQLCKYLSKFGKVLYNSLEEGKSESLKLTCIRENMLEVGSRFQIIDKEPIEDLEKRLQKHKSADIVIIDSSQYIDMKIKDLRAFLDRNRKKLFIFVSHADGKHPEGHLSKKIKFHSSVKIHIEGYRARIESRYGGDQSKHYTIWHEGAAKYWGEEF
jgi:vacuolar-type H+-ATPase subunit F/Vma7